ncbi:proton-conducting transporter membrane subunit [Desulfobulbus sp.]|jgi:hydrogenase-4 component F|uniref:proton-conducting transporter transmembrane domain-containing protein n=1 Tax=Desulfobulbus sp. TaxID=895 RepID=UPI0027B91415|nr:proton-conducting transporter membrane subunit [Desulfobulbus sp.]
MLEAVFCLPLFAGLIAFLLPVKLGRGVLVVGALLHLQLTLLAWLSDFPPLLPGYFSTAPAGILVLLVTSFIFVFIAPYSIFYMREQEMQSEPIFIGSMLLFLGTMSMAALAEHPIVFWIAIEATTLVSAPLIFVNRSKKALEATWKYVLICSVGIALALLGFFFITLSMDRAGIDVPLTFSSLNTAAKHLDPLWLKIGFIFVIIGFGTKMGLAPMHTWLPDAHSEAPSPASALLSGALLNCAFLGIFKVHTLMVLAGLGDFSGSLLIGFGLFSILVAGIFILKQPDYKRMLAYSSIENMGVIAFGVGIGGMALYGAMLHLIHHSLLKSSLFLSAGNLLLGFGSKIVAQCGGMTRLLPRTFVSFFAGFLGISGLPPFGVFVSELLILIGAFKAGHPVAGGLFIASLALVVAGFARIVTSMSFGPSRQEILVPEQTLRIVSPFALLLTSAVLCVWMPEPLHQIIINTIAVIGGTIHG